MTVTDHVLANMRKQVNVTLLMVAVRRRLATETDPAMRYLLAGMMVELNSRLPERQ